MLRKSVSIHLMLLFIAITIQTERMLYLFQYISCYSLSDNPIIYCEGYNKFQYISCYSLSFSDSCRIRIFTTFQYISCYSLSGKRCEGRCCGNQFQYISCYSLSLSELCGNVCQQQFQYISCYSLSVLTGSWLTRLLVSIHLMLLFIMQRKYGVEFLFWFQYISCYSLSKKDKQGDKMKL